MPPVPSSCKAINRSTSLGPRKTRASPTATASRIRLAAARRSSPTANRLLEKVLICRDAINDRSADVQAVNLKLATFSASWQGPRLQALIKEKEIPAIARLQSERDSDQAGIQIEARQESTPGDINASNDRAVQ